MSTLVFLSGNKKFDQFIPTYTTDPTVAKSPPAPPRRIGKRKRQQNGGSDIPTDTLYHHEQPPSPTSTSSTSSLSSLSTTSTTTSSPGLTTRRPYRRKSQCTPQRRLSLDANTHTDPDDEKALTTLEDELDYTQDTLATLNVMFGSLRQAYITCEPQLTPHPTRLDAMEKELLSAYDDLELQVIHLDRHIQKLESSWRDWKFTNHHTPS